MEKLMEKRMKPEELILEAKNFFDAHKKEIIGKAARAENKVIHVNFDEVASFSPMISENLMGYPEETLIFMETALEEAGIIQNARVRLLSLPDSHSEKIRNLRSKHLNKFIQIEGIIRQATEVRPQVVNAKFECPTCGTIISILQIESKFREPRRCSCGRRGHFRLLSKDLVDAQRLVIEESPESLTGGEQPRRISIFLKEDLVEPKMEEKTTPGSRVRVIGTLKEVVKHIQTGGQLTRYDIAIEANNIIPLEESYEEVIIDEEDEIQIRELAEDKKLFEKMTNTIAPSIYGYKEVKQALVLQLLGGVKKTLPDGTTKRGDMHILLVGDPGVAKSIILTFMANIAPKGRYVVGRGASGAGITATVVRDEFLRGWSLEAGAIVLAHRGMLALDEMDKMDPHDTSAMHEAMEQQCYHKDFELMLADWSKIKIGKLVDELINKSPNNIQKYANSELLDLNDGIKVLTTDFESIYPTGINRVMRKKAPDKFVRIKLANGREITVTPDHPCWAVDSGKITTKNAKNLSIGEFFPIPGELPIEGEEQSFEIKPFKNGPQLCKILGYHISDGCYSVNRGKKNGIQFWNNDKDLIDDYSNAVRSFFGKNPSLSTRGKQFEACVVSKDIVEFLMGIDKNLMERGILKTIPDRIINCKKEDLSLLIRALFDGDGTVVNVKRNGCRASLITENKKLAEQVSEILLRFGIISSIYNDREFFKVDVTGAENLLKFHNQIGFTSIKKRERLKRYLQTAKTFRSITDIVPNVSKSIREIFKHLKINAERDLKTQIAVEEHHKHRIFLQKMIKLAEEKVDRLIEGQDKIRKANSNREMRTVREKLELSKLSLSKKLGLTRYMLTQNEKMEELDKNYKDVLLNEITGMLAIIPRVREMKKLAFGKIRWSRIKSVEIIDNTDSEWVYDITIEPTWAFISNNMVLHNCVSISKATIQARLRAETSILGAANPKFGRFDPYQTVAAQIDLPPALINRFDIIFIMKDLPDRSKDEAIAAHVLMESKEPKEKGAISRDLFKKYIAYARQRIKPQLTDEAIDEIKKFYVDLRNVPASIGSEQATKPLPISARQLDGLVRLSESSAKLRLSNIVTRDDARMAIELMRYYLMKVGYDYETQTFDIDRIASGVSASQRGRVMAVKEALSKLEGRLGKLIPLEELKRELQGKINEKEIDESLERLARAGDIFYPRKGFVQVM